MSNHGFYRGPGSSVRNPIPGYIAFCIFLFLLLFCYRGLLYAILMSIGFSVLIIFLISANERQKAEQQLQDKIRKEEEEIARKKKFMYSMKIFALNKDIAVLNTSFYDAARLYSFKFNRYPHIEEKDSMTGRSFTIEEYEVYTKKNGQNLKSVKELIDGREITYPQIFYSKYLLSTLEELNELILAKKTQEAAQREAEELDKLKEEKSKLQEAWLKFYEQYELPFRFVSSLKPGVSALKEDVASIGTLHNSKYHVVLLDTLAEGRLKRSPGEFLCTQSEKFNLETTPLEPEYHVIDCKKCLEILNRWRKPL